ncbi:hypothetical protein IAT38_005123 [Cryptococcus sp. DSM 104549]
MDVVSANPANTEALARVGGDGKIKSYDWTVLGEGEVGAAHLVEDSTRISASANLNHEWDRKWDRMVEDVKEEAKAAARAEVKSEMARRDALPKFVESVHLLLVETGYHLADSKLQSRFSKAREGKHKKVIYWTGVDLRNIAIDAWEYAEKSSDYSALQILPTAYRTSISTSVMLFKTLPRERNSLVHEIYEPKEFEDVVGHLEDYEIILPEDQDAMFDTDAKKKLITAFSEAAAAAAVEKTAGRSH